MAHLWESCLPGMSVKLKYLCLAHRKHSDQAHLWTAAGRKKSPPEADWNQGMFDFTPSPFSIKEAWILTQARWFIWDTTPPSSQSAGFPNKVTIPCPNNSFLDLLACCVAVSMSLDSVTRYFLYSTDKIFTSLRDRMPYLNIIAGHSETRTTPKFPILHPDLFLLLCFLTELWVY